MKYHDLLSHVPPELRRGVRCFSFSRWGGTSPKPFHELNVAVGVGDMRENVKANLRLIKEFCQVEEIFSPRQVHGTKFFHVRSGPFDGGETRLNPEADGLFSDMTDIGLMIKHADCQAVVLFDPVRRAIANIHCGWKGSVRQILPKAVHELSTVYGSVPQDIWAGISPSLGPCCAEFKEWKSTLPPWMHPFQVRPDHFDFWAISRYQLMNAGLSDAKIFCVEVCTKCNHNYFSYRREGVTGRVGTLVALSSRLQST